MDGRWLNCDPILQAGGVNLYEYVKNNPLTLSDPTGKCPGKGEKTGSSSWTSTIFRSPLDVVKARIQRQSSEPSPSYKMAKGANTIANWMVPVNALVESIAISKHMHGAPTAQDVAKISPHFPYKGLLNVFVQAKVVSVAGFSAFVGGMSGVVYYANDIKKNGRNTYNTASLIGSAMFAGEGVLTYASIVKPQIQHHLHPYAMVTDLFKTIGALGALAKDKPEDRKKALYAIPYGSYTLGHLRMTMGKPFITDSLVQTAYSQGLKAGIPEMILRIASAGIARSGPAGFFVFGAVAHFSVNRQFTHKQH